MTRKEILKIAKPILFKTDMVRVIMDGRKTVTRRLIKANLIEDGEYEYEVANGRYRHKLADCAAYKQCYDVEIKPPYKVGDYLYVRETWARIGYDVDSIWFEEPEKLYDGQIIYRADFTENIPECRWHPSTHMSKEAARIFLRVTDVRVERLQDINGYGILAEGVDNGKSNPTMGARWDNMQLMAFSELWNSTVKKSDFDRYGWAWVWVIEFERLEVE